MSKVEDRDYPEELPVGYYLDNFRRILDFVDDHYRDILSPDEKRFSEIADIEAAAGELIAAGLLGEDEPRELPEELALLRKAEILELISECGPDSDRAGPSRTIRSLRKEQLVELALSLPGDTRSWIRGRFHIYRPQRQREILIYRLLFFGNLYQDLTEFVVTDLGHVRYEPYEIRKKDRLFHCREVLDLTFRLIELNDAFYNAVEGRSVNEIDKNALLELIEYLPEGNTVYDDPHLRRMRDNLINSVARHLERIGDHSQALHLYRLAELPPSRERRARILERLGRIEESLQLCRQIQTDPWEEAEQEFAERFIRRLSRKLGLAGGNTRAL